MNKRWIFLLVILSLAVSSISCGISIDLGTKDSSPTPPPPTATAITTSEPATPTSTTIPPTATLLPTATATTQPAESPVGEQPAEPQLAEPTASPVPLPEVISVHNAPSLSFKRLDAIGLGSLQKLRVSPDGKTVLLSFTTKLVLLNIGDFSPVWSISPTRMLSDVVFTKDGSHLVSYSPGGTVMVFDAATGAQLITTIAQREGVRSMALSAHGEYFAVLDYSDKTRVYDAQTGKEVQDNNGQSNPGGINSIQLSPGGGSLLIDGFDSKPRKQVQQWNVTDGKYKIGLLGVLTEMVNWKFSPDGKRVFGVNTRSLTSIPVNTLTAWNANNGALIKSYDPMGIITDYVISPDGATALVATEDNQIHLLDVESGREKGTFTGHTSRIAGMDFSPDSQGVISLDANGKIIAWDVVNQKAVGELVGSPASSISSMMFSPDGRYAALLSPDRKKVGIVDANLNSSRVLGPEEYALRAPAISPQGGLAAAVDSKNRIIIWENETGRKLQMIEAKTRAAIKKLHFSPDGKTIASLNTGQVFLWDVATGAKLKEFVGQNDFAWSPDGKTIASDSADNRLYLTSVETGKKVAAIDAEAITSINYSQDGSLISVGGTRVQPKERGLINLVFQVDTGSRLRLPVEMPELPGALTSTAFSPNMDLLAGVDAQGNVYIWSLLDGSKVAYFEEIAANPGTMMFKTDGTELYVGGGDGAIGVVSTVGGSTRPVETQPDASAAAADENQLPELSAQPYVHSKGVVSVNLPMGWVLEEPSGLTFISSDPKGKGNIAFLATNTITQLTDEAFLYFINGCESEFSSSSTGYKEIDRGIEPAKGSGFVKKLVSISGKDYLFETYYTRDGSVVYQINFITQKPYVELYLPLYTGMYSSLKIDKSFVSSQIPYEDLNDHQSENGKYDYSVPASWLEESLPSTDPSALQYTAPDKSAFMQVLSTPWNANDLTGDTEIYGAIQTVLEDREGFATIVTRDKAYDGWLISYALPEKNLNGVILGKRVENTLQIINVEYKTPLVAEYRPLAQKILEKFVLK